MNNFQLTPINDSIIQEASSDWLNEAGNDLFQVEYARFFSETLAKSQDAFYAVGIPGNPVVLAFVEIIAKQPSVKAKFLRITVHPSLLPLEADGNQETLVSVYMFGIKSTFDLASVHGATEVKIYGRTDHLFGVLKTVATLLNDSPLDGFTHILENKW